MLYLGPQHYKDKKEQPPREFVDFDKDPGKVRYFAILPGIPNLINHEKLISCFWELVLSYIQKHKIFSTVAEVDFYDSGARIPKSRIVLFNEFLVF